MSPKPTPGQIREINDSTRYAMWSVFKVTSPVPQDRAKVAAEVPPLFAALAEQGAGGRGAYAVAGRTAGADFSAWGAAGTLPGGVASGKVQGATPSETPGP